MKTQNYLIYLRGLFRASQCSDVGFDRRFTVGSPSVQYASTNGARVAREWLKPVAVFLLLFTFAVGQMRGAIYSLTPNKSNTGRSETSYITTLTEFTYESGSSVKWKMNQWNPDNLQIKTNQSSASSEFRFYNNSAFAGKITKVVITLGTVGTILKDNGFMFLGGTSAQTGTSSGSAGTWNSTAKTITWTPGSSTNYTYFAFYQSGKAASGTNKLATSNSIVVTYLTAVTLNKNGGTDNGAVKFDHNATAYATSSFTAVTRSDYTCTGYWTASSGGTKILNADGTFANSNITVSSVPYVSSSKWVYAPGTLTLYAQWEASSSSVSLTKAGETNGTFTMTQSSTAVTSVTTTSAAQAVTVTATPNAGYYLSNLTATNPTTGTASVTGSGNTRTVTYSKGANGASTITATFSPIWYLEGDFNGWGATDPLTNITSNVATVTKSLSKTTAYEFKVYNAKDDTWYGNNGRIIDDVSGWTFSTSEDNCKVFATVADDYTFKFNISNQQMQVIYPDMTHPNDAYVYLTKWWDCYVHYWYTDGEGDHALVDWGYDTQLSRYEDICGTDYWCVPILDGYPKLIMKDNAGDPSNTTGDQTTASNAGKYITHNGVSWGWHDFTTYSITFAGNGNTGGSMSNVNGICPSGSTTLAANGYTKTGYTFSNWKTDKAVTANGSPVAANGSVPGGATLSSIGSNITLTAQWSANTISLTLDKNGGSADGSGSIKFDANSGTISTAPTRTGYTVEGYYTDAACTAANKVLTNTGAVVSSTVSGYTTSGTWTRETTPTKLYTKWTAKTTTVSFNPNGGTGATSNKTATYDQAMPTPITCPTRDGYVFGGYFDGTTPSAKQYYTGSGTSARNWDKEDATCTLYARWYGDPIAWCDPDVTVTGDVHLTSTKDVYVHSTSDAGNLISISSSDMGSATRMEVVYLNADAADAEVDKASSPFRFYNAAGTATVDALDLDYEWGTSHSLRYTPSDYNVTNHYKLRLDFKRGDKVLKTVTKNIYGRGLPEKFVIAVKNSTDSKWYALPSDLESTKAAQGVIALSPALEIEVDNTTTPTKATIAPSSRIYKAMGRNTATSNMYGIRFTTTGSNKMQAASDVTYVWLPTANADASQVWQLASSDLRSYTVTMPSIGSKKLGIFVNSGDDKIGYAASPHSYGVYFLPVQTEISELAATAKEWGHHEVLVEANASSASATKAQGKLGATTSDKETLPTPVATNTYLLKLDGDLDFTSKGGQTLQLKWYDSSDKLKAYSWVTLPNIIATTATSWASISPAPTIDDIVVLKSATIVGATGKAKRVVLDQSGSSGKLEISAGKELVVAETVRKFDGSSFGATGETDITISSTSTLALGALVMGTHDGTNKATVNFYTKSTGKKQENTSVGQYVGTPFNDETNILYNWYNSWVYGIKYTSNVIGWERVEEGSGMDPFKGYCVFSADAWDSGTGHSYWQQGTLVSSDNHTCSSLNYQSGTYTNPNNENLLANSWMAPIKIKAMQSSDFTNTYATVYIFNSTSNSAYSSLAGNYTAHTVGTSEGVIPAMQSFSVFTTGSGASVSLDYNKIVYAPAVAGTASPAVNSAPSRSGRSADEADKMRLFVRSENGCGDMLYMWERADFTEGFENGWDGHKLYGESYAPQLYAITPDGFMAVNCVPDWEGTVVGFKKGTEDNVYTFTFEYEGENTWYLNDLREQTSTLISSESSYMFMASDEDMVARFIISRMPIHSTPTGIEQSAISGQKSAVRKIVIDDHVYIIRNGKMYSAEGVMVR